MHYSSNGFFFVERAFQPPNTTHSRHIEVCRLSSAFFEKPINTRHKIVCAIKTRQKSSNEWTGSCGSRCQRKGRSSRAGNIFQEKDINQSVRPPKWSKRNTPRGRKCDDAEVINTFWSNDGSVHWLMACGYLNLYIHRFLCRRQPCEKSRNRCFQSHGILWILNCIIFKMIIIFFRRCYFVFSVGWAAMVLVMVWLGSCTHHLPIPSTSCSLTHQKTLYATQTIESDLAWYVLYLVSISDIWWKRHTCVTRSVLHVAEILSWIRWYDFSFVSTIQLIRVKKYREWQTKDCFLFASQSRGLMRSKQNEIELIFFFFVCRTMPQFWWVWGEVKDLYQLIVLLLTDPNKWYYILA